MSQIEVDKIIPQSGNATQLGESGDTITIPAGATITNNGTANGFGSADTEKVKVSANDTTAGFLNGKLVAGTNISLTEGTDGGNETLTAALSGTIATAQIADDAVTLAKMAPGTDGNIISYDASGNPVAVATGNDGQVLTSTGAGSPPVFEDAAGGAWSKLITTTVSSNTSAVEFNSTYLTSTYRDYRITISDMSHTTGSGAYPELQIGNGSSYITNGDYRFAMRAWKSDASTNQEVSQATSQFKLSADTIAGNEATKKSSFEITMFDPLSTASFFTLQATGSFISSGDLACGQYGGGFFNGQQGTAINLVKIFMNTGSINAGTFTLYGRKI